jgi:hypothetical protein
VQLSLHIIFPRMCFSSLSSRDHSLVSTYPNSLDASIMSKSVIINTRPSHFILIRPLRKDNKPYKAAKAPQRTTPRQTRPSTPRPWLPPKTYAIAHPCGDHTNTRKSYWVLPCQRPASRSPASHARKRNSRFSNPML